MDSIHPNILKDYLCQFRNVALVSVWPSLKSRKFSLRYLSLTTDDKVNWDK